MQHSSGEAIDESVNTHFIVRIQTVEKELVSIMLSEMRLVNEVGMSVFVS